MSIEIRPAAIQRQLERKKTLLNEMRDELLRVRMNIYAFTGSFELQGEAFDAARAHFSHYLALIDGTVSTLLAVEQADKAVSSALGRFGGAERASQQEWLEKKWEAERRVQEADQRIAQERRAKMARAQSGLLTGMLANAASDQLINSLESTRRHWLGVAEAAAEQVRKIEEYCAETDHLYEGIDGSLGGSIASGISAMQKGYSAGNWAPIEGSWEGDIQTHLEQEDYFTLLMRSIGGPDYLGVIGNGVAEGFVGASIETAASAMRTNSIAFGLDGLVEAGKGASKGGAAVFSVAMLALTTPSTYDRSYGFCRAVGGTEAQARSRAEAAVAKDWTVSAASIGAGMAAGAAIGTAFCPGPGTAVGALVGAAGSTLASLGVSLSAEALLNADLDGDGITWSDRIDEGWEKDGWHAVVDWASDGLVGDR